MPGTPRAAPLHEAARSGWLDGRPSSSRAAPIPTYATASTTRPSISPFPRRAGKPASTSSSLGRRSLAQGQERQHSPPYRRPGKSILTAPVDRAGSPANAANAAGDTALHLALWGGRLEIRPPPTLERRGHLLANGKGETPLSMAIAIANAAPQATGAAGTAASAFRSHPPRPLRRLRLGDRPRAAGRQDRSLRGPPGRGDPRQRRSEGTTTSAIRPSTSPSPSRLAPRPSPSLPPRGRM